MARLLAGDAVGTSGHNGTAYDLTGRLACEKSRNGLGLIFFGLEPSCVVGSNPNNIAECDDRGETIGDDKNMVVK